jgi:hypothetical protein
VWFLESEGRRRSDAGLPAGHPLFRITGTTALEPGLREAGFAPVVTTASEGGTICLAVASPEAVPALRAQVLRLAERGVVSRVEAEPTL